MTAGTPARKLYLAMALEVPGSGRHARLTATEQRVAALIADGLTNAEIASALDLSKRTVEFHVSHLYAKLGVTTRTAIAARVRDGSR